MCIQPGIPFTSAHSGDVHYPSIRAPLDIETDIPFCRSILPVGGGGGGARVGTPSFSAFTLISSTYNATSSGGFAACASVAAPFARLFRQCAVRRRSRTTCSQWRVALLREGGYRASLRAARKQPGDNRGEITSNSEKKHPRARARNVSQNFSRGRDG